MAQGSYNRRKTVNKSVHWHRHGKHRPILGWLCEQIRSSIRRLPPPMYETAAEAFAAAKAEMIARRKKLPLPESRT